MFSFLYRVSLLDTVEKPGRVRTKGTRKGPHLCSQGRKMEGTRKGPHLCSQLPLPLHDRRQDVVGTGVEGRWRAAPCGCPSRPTSRRHKKLSGRELFPPLRMVSIRM